MPKLSLEVIKAVIKAAKATSPEREELINDLECLADSGNKFNFVPL